MLCASSGTSQGKGYAGVGEHVRILYRGRGKPASQKDANRAHAQLRSRRVGQCPAQDLAHPAQTPLRPWQVAKAIHVLQAREIGG
jgi:hypothetical protein